MWAEAEREEETTAVKKSQSVTLVHTFVCVPRASPELPARLPAPPFSSASSASSAGLPSITSQAQQHNQSQVWWSWAASSRWHVAASSASSSVCLQQQHSAGLQHAGLLLCVSRPQLLLRHQFHHLQQTRSQTTSGLMQLAGMAGLVASTCPRPSSRHWRSWRWPIRRRWLTQPSRLVLFFVSRGPLQALIGSIGVCSVDLAALAQSGAS